MNVASLELCKELYEVSGGVNDAHWIEQGPNEYLAAQQDYPTLAIHDDALDNYPYFKKKLVPAYDLGYLLRKLPPNFNTHDARGSFEFFLKTTGREWFAGYNKPEMGKWLYDGNHGVWERPCEAETPENAAAKLCIELFKQHILHKGGEI